MYETIPHLEVNSGMCKLLLECTPVVDHYLYLTEICCPQQEIDVMGKKAIIIFVPVPQLRAYQKIQARLVRELEKKFSGKHVVFIAQRRILAKPTRKTRRKNKQKRPRRLVINLASKNLVLVKSYRAIPYLL